MEDEMVVKYFLAVVSITAGYIAILLYTLNIQTNPLFNAIHTLNIQTDLFFFNAIHIVFNLFNYNLLLLLLFKTTFFFFLLFFFNQTHTD